MSEDIAILAQDITERKKTEERIDLIRRNHEIILSSTDEGILGLDSQGNHTFVNSAAAKMLGYESEELIGRPSHSIWHHSYSDGSPYPLEECEINKCIIDGRATRVSTEVFWKKDGTHFPVEYSSEPIYELNRLVGAVVVFTDITARKKDEQSLRKNEKLFRTSFESATVGGAMVAKDGTFIEVNDKACEIWGYSRVELLQLKFTDITFKEDLVESIDLVKKLILGMTDSFIMQKRYIRKDGGIVWGLVSVSAIRNEIAEFEYFLIYIQNITETKKLEHDLIDESRKNLRILDNLQDAYFQADLSGNSVIVNPMAVSMYGYDSEAEMLGLPAVSFFADPKERDRLITKINENGKLHDHLAYGMRKDGTSFPVSMNVQFVTSDNGEIIGTEGLVRDITEQVKIESAIKLEYERYHALIESTNDWIWVVDPKDYKLTLFNSSVSSYFKRNHGVTLKPGMSREEMLSKKRRDLWRELYDEAIRKGGFSTEYQTASENLHFLVSLAPLVIENTIVGISVFAKDITTETNYKERLESSNQKLSIRLKQSLNAISRIGELRDVYTAGHQKKVAELSCAIASELGLSDETISNISNGALIHDIGKIYIASDILNKPGKITNLEYQIMQTHAEYGYEIVKEIDFPSPVIDMIHQHHERLDGSGYPQKLTGEQIILESRILAVADVVDAMTSHRPYRPALGIDVALEEISKYRGERYDCDVVDACTRLFREKGFQFMIIN